MSRPRALRRVGLVVLIANLGLAAAKGGVWYVSGSLALGSEAVNSVADAGYSGIVLAGLYVTTKPPDFEHPHGHERIEPFVSLVVAAAIFVAGGAVLYNAASALVTGDVTVARGPIAAAVLGGAAVVKYALYRYVLRVAEDHHSPALRATAVDNRNDILTAGAALVGVVGAGVGYPYLDPLAAAVVSVAILYTGVDIVRDNVNYLVGGAPPEGLRREIVRRALVHPDVEGAHDVVAHYVGPEVDVSLHIEVTGEKTLREAHAIETAVMDTIRELPEVDDAFVHVDPKELGEWKDDREVDRLTGPAEGGSRTPDDGDRDGDDGDQR